MRSILFPNSKTCRFLLIPQVGYGYYYQNWSTKTFSPESFEATTFFNPPGINVNVFAQLDQLSRTKTKWWGPHFGGGIDFLCSSWEVELYYFYHVLNMRYTETFRADFQVVSPAFGNLLSESNYRTLIR